MQQVFPRVFFFFSIKDNVIMINQTVAISTIDLEDIMVLLRRFSQQHEIFLTGNHIISNLRILESA